MPRLWSISSLSLLSLVWSLGSHEVHAICDYTDCATCNEPWFGMSVCYWDVNDECHTVGSVYGDDSVDTCQVWHTCDCDDSPNVISCIGCNGDVRITGSQAYCSEPVNCPEPAPEWYTCDCDDSPSVISCSGCDGNVRITGNQAYCSEPVDCPEPAPEWYICDCDDGSNDDPCSGCDGNVRITGNQAYCSEPYDCPEPEFPEWTGTFEPDDTCDQSSCCCLIGCLQLQQEYDTVIFESMMRCSNDYGTLVPVSGVVNLDSSESYVAETEFGGDETLSVRLSYDGSSIRITNSDYPQCETFARKIDECSTVDNGSDPDANDTVAIAAAVGSVAALVVGVSVVLFVRSRRSPRATVVALPK